jgi:hypothetical protein
MQTNVSDDWMDSTLWLEDATSVRNATLTIKIKVFLQREASQSLMWTASNGMPRSVRTTEWGIRWHDWHRDLRRVVEDGWSDRLWLRPDRDWRTGSARGQGGVNTAPSLALRLRVEYVPRSAAHVVIRSYCLPHPAPGQTPVFARSNMEAPYIESHRRCSLQGNDTIGNMDTNDVLPKSAGQIAAIHEFGHYIGLSHVNAVAAAAANAGPNSTLAYGVGDQRRDVMGAGTEIAGWHAYPWCRRLRRHLGGEQPNGTDWQTRDPMVWETGRGETQVRWRVMTERASSIYVGRPAELVIPES